jgi:hypothetical protein
MDPCPLNNLERKSRISTSPLVTNPHKTIEIEIFDVVSADTGYAEM